MLFPLPTTATPRTSLELDDSGDGLPVVLWSGLAADGAASGLPGCRTGRGCRCSASTHAACSPARTCAATGWRPRAPTSPRACPGRPASSGTPSTPPTTGSG